MINEDVDKFNMMKISINLGIYLMRMVASELDDYSVIFMFWFRVRHPEPS